jgi:uncharacterized protein HemY
MNIDQYYSEVSRLWPKPGESVSKEVVELCRKAIAEYGDQPDSSVLWYDLGILMQRCDEECDYKASDYLWCFENAIKRNPKNGEAYQEIGYVLDIYFDDYQRAEEALRKAIELGTGHESYCALARVLTQVDRIEDALDCISDEKCPCSNHPSIQEIRREIIEGLWSWRALT